MKDRSRIIDRVKKLLRMSKDCGSPNEAAIAAGRARKLIDEYQISEMDLTTLEDDEFGTEYFDDGSKVKSTIVSIMSLAVARLNDCKSVWTWVEGYRPAVKFQGLLVDAVSATEMLKYLKDEAYRQSRRLKLGRADAHTFRYGFSRGVAEQVKKILADRQQLKTSNGTSLMVLKNQLVAQRFGQQKVSFTKTRVSGSNEAYQRGLIAGKTVSLNRQVTEKPLKKVAGK